MFVESVKGKLELPPLLGVCVMEECLNSLLPRGVCVRVRERSRSTGGNSEVVLQWSDFILLQD